MKACFETRVSSRHTRISSHHTRVSSRHTRVSSRHTRVSSRHNLYLCSYLENTCVFITKTSCLVVLGTCSLFILGTARNTQVHQWVIRRARNAKASGTQSFLLVFSPLHSKKKPTFLPSASRFPKEPCF